ncbi:coiled-coil domain-containing protein 97-like [Oppia nitens]|uniref:coiled-coil domain-containing protein 97-like n=1 Tax=Oppia nitens TaxID=1686743 RepID=UPI0023DC3948|nr:coiled-coil domain-containing protein 97-like [Oppia nitens]
MTTIDDDVVVGIVGDNTSSSFVDKLIDKMVDKIANRNDVYFKSQQIGESDLTVDEKRHIVDKLFNDNKQVFLQRYGNCLTKDELNCFDRFDDNSDDHRVIESLLKMLRQKLNKRQTTVKNRRFQMVDKLMTSGHYFSDSEMESRQPELFEQMIGQYMTDEEKSKLTIERYAQNEEPITLSSFLMKHLVQTSCQTSVNNNNNIEEFDSDSDDNDEENDDNGGSSGDYDDNEEDNNESNDNQRSQPENDISEERKLELREEFMKIMSENFIDGKDKQYYDYNECDENSELDYNQMADRDNEDKYFDDEDDD